MALPLRSSDRGGKGPCRRPMREIPERGITVPAPTAVGSPTGWSLATTARSTGSSPVPTSAAGGSSRASSPDCTATEGSRCWRGLPAWIGTPSPSADASWTGPTASRRAGCGVREADPNGWRPAPRNPDGPGGVAGGRHRGGSLLRHEVDAPLAPHAPKGPQAPGLQGVPSDHRPALARPALLAADLPQGQGGDPPQGPGSPVPLPDAAAEAVPHAGMARDQRRYQEEGVGRRLQEPGPLLAARGSGGARPRLPELGHRAGDPLWHL